MKKIPRYLILRIVLFSGVLFFLSACKTTRQGMSRVPKMKSDSLVSLQKAMQLPAFTSFYAKMKLSLTIEGKQQALRGHLKIKRNERIQISIAPLLGIEMARLEVTPTKLLLVDRVHHNFIKGPVSRLREIFQCDLNFYALQALLLNRVFHPVHKQAALPVDFNIERDSNSPDTFFLETEDESKSHYRFQLKSTIYRLLTTQLESKMPSRVEWKYANFQKIEQHLYPMVMEMTAKTPQLEMNARFSFSRVSWKERTIRPTSLSKRYERIVSDDLLKNLLPQ